MVNTIEKNYIQELIGHCSYFRLDGLPAVGEVFYQKITLEDIYAPLRLSESKDADDLLKWGASISDVVNEKHSQQSQTTISTTTEYNGLFSTCDSFEESSTPFSDLIAFIDAHLGKLSKPVRNEYDSFIWQLDEQIERLSKGNAPSSGKSAIESAQTTEEFISAIDVGVSNWVDNSDMDASSQIVSEQRVYIREQNQLYDDKPVGPLIDGYPSRKIILSNPGCGKTTLAKRIALAYASMDKENIENYSLPGNLFPMLLYCRSLNGESINADDSFIDVAFKMARKQYDSIPDDFDSFRKIIEKHAEADLLLIVDGYDELFSKDVQEHFAKTLYEFLAQYKNAHLLLTSRIASFVNDGYSDIESIKYINQIPNVKKNLILSMSQDEIEAFVRRWHKVLFPFDPDKMQIAENIIGQLRQPGFKYLRKMTCVPLHLSNILLVARTSNKIPNSKSQLFEDYLTIALNWHSTGAIETSDMKSQLAYVAYHMTKREMQRITKSQLKDVLLNCAEDLDGEFLVVINEDNIETFITELEERTCVLKKSRRLSGEDYYQFTHLNLQEYLTAYAIAKGCSEDIATPLEVISQRLNKNAWREVIILTGLLVNRTERNQIVDFLINEAETTEDNYYSTNLLFEFIANGIINKPEKRHAIYDLLFKEHITDNQIKKICEFLDDARSEDFKQYVSEKFASSMESGNSDYSFALATIYAYEFLQSGLKPLEKAESMVVSSDGFEMVIGLYIFTVLGWCKYCKISSEFAAQDIILSSDFGEKIRNLLLSKSQYSSDIATALKDIALAEYMVDIPFLDKDVYELLIEDLSNSKKRVEAEKILSVFPLSFSSLSYSSGIVTNDLRGPYLEEYRTFLSDPKKAEETVFKFSICAMLGCWDLASEEFLDEFTDLEGYYELNKRNADDAAKAKLKILRKQISDMADPVSAGLYHYEMSEFEKAKDAFLVAYKKENTTVSNNLAYMLRRGEIDKVIIDKKSYSVEELLQEGVLANEPFSITNYALQKAKENDGINYEVGLSIVSALGKLPKHLLNGVYSWWSDLAQKGENEGYIVLAWLIEMGVISTTPYGSIEDLKQLIS